jgi:hypothetical protein
MKEERMASSTQVCFCSLVSALQLPRKSQNAASLLYIAAYKHHPGSCKEKRREQNQAAKPVLICGHIPTRGYVMLMLKTKTTCFVLSNCIYIYTAICHCLLAMLDFFYL